MTSTELLIKEVVLSPALANAALLIAAPSLGCLNTYTKTFIDLCTAYGLPLPDLAHILQYSPMALSSSSISLPKTDCFRKPTQVTPDIQEPPAKYIEIKKEPEDFEIDTIDIKCEINNNKTLYNTCLYNTNPITQGTSLEKHIKNEATQLEIPIDIALEIPYKRKYKSKVAHTKPSTRGTTLEKHVIKKDPQLEASFDIALKIPINLSKVPLMDQVGNKSKKTLQKIDATNESQLEIPPLQAENTSDYEPSPNTDHYSTMLRDTTQSFTSSKSPKFIDNSSMLSPKTSVYSIINNTGKKQYTYSRKKARKIRKQSTSSTKKPRKIMEDTQWGTPFDRALDKIEKVSKESLKDQSITKRQRTSVLLLPKINSFQKDTTSDNKPLAISHHYSTKISDTTKSLTSSKSSKISSNYSMLSPTTSVCSTLDKTGRKQYTPSSEEAKMTIKDTQWNKIFGRSLGKTVKVSTFSQKDQDRTKSKETSQVITAINKGQSKIKSCQKDNVSDNKLSANSLVNCLLDNTGRRQYTTSSEEARNKLAQCGMPIEFASGTICYTVVRDCLIHIATTVDGPICTSTLCIWLKDEGRDFTIPYADIREISQYNIDVMVSYYSKLTNCIEHIYLRPQATKSRPKKNNIAATINWLQTFLG